MILKNKILSLCLLLTFTLSGQKNDFKILCDEFVNRYESLLIPETQLDYKLNFENIKPNDHLKKQEEFFTSFSKKLSSFDNKSLDAEQSLRYQQLNYEVAINLERIGLEKKWNAEGRKIPTDGLHSLSNYKEWYSYYIKHFTSVNITPEQVFEMGSAGVKKAQQEIRSLQKQMGYADENAFYSALKNENFYFDNKDDILKAYSQIDKIVRENLGNLFITTNIAEVDIIEWPNADINTPPGMYLNKTKNSLDKDIFQYNFYNGKHNKRAMEWLYMHEAIPGHHLQSSTKYTTEGDELKNDFFYFGNSEGWACYVEELGKEIGLYQNPYTYLGKWEWDLVRSARLVMEVGIHYHGWSYDKALRYWKENIKGQDEIAEREIKRITKWAGQALCYKVGALTIQQIIELRSKKGEDIRSTHQFFLTHSDVPLQVLLDNQKS
jgi:uncharacterized protein (DUF885 family)